MHGLYFSISIVALSLAAWLPAHAANRRRRSRVGPTARTIRLSPQRLAARIREFGMSHESIDVFDEEGFLCATWHLDAEHDDAARRASMSDYTYLLRMELRRDEVRVRYARGVVQRKPRRTRSPHASTAIDWEWPPAPIAGSWPPRERRGGDSTLRGLIEPLRAIVLDAGFAWQPAIDVELA